MLQVTGAQNKLSKDTNFVWSNEKLMNDDTKWCPSGSDDADFRLFKKIRDKAMKIC